MAVNELIPKEKSEGKVVYVAKIPGQPVDKCYNTYVLCVLLFFDLDLHVELDSTIDGACNPLRDVFDKGPLESNRLSQGWR